jgi:hypothetical protein
MWRMLRAIRCCAGDRDGKAAADRAFRAVKLPGHPRMLLPNQILGPISHGFASLAYVDLSEGVQAD